MKKHEPPPNLWNDLPREPRKIVPGGNFRVEPEPRRTGERSPLKVVFVLAFVVVAAAAGWHFLAPAWARFRVSGDVEKSAMNVLRRVLPTVSSEEELRAALAHEVDASLTGPLASKARWFVCFGPRGEDVRVVRDDAFDASERAFAERLVDEARLKHDVDGVQHDVFTYPLGASYATVAVDGKPWCVVVGWTERK